MALTPLALSPLTEGMVVGVNLGSVTPSWQSLPKEWQTNPAFLSPMADGLLALLGRLQTIESQWLNLLLGQPPVGVKVSSFLAHLAAAWAETMPTPLPQSLPADGQGAPFSPLPINGSPAPLTLNPLPSPSSDWLLGDEPSSMPFATSVVPSGIQRLVVESAQRHGIDPALALAVAKAESEFNPSARSPKGAMGVMQLMPETAESLGVTDPFNPAQNIEGGVRYLRQLLERFGGQIPLAIAAYNAGPNAVTRYGGVPPYPETQTFLRRVLAYWRAFREQLGEWVKGQVGGGRIGNQRDEQLSQQISRTIGKAAEGQPPSPPRHTSPTQPPEHPVSQRTTEVESGRPVKGAPQVAAPSDQPLEPFLPPLVPSLPDAKTDQPSGAALSSSPRPTSSSALRPSVTPSDQPLPPVHRLVAEVPTAGGEKAVRVLIQLENGIAEKRGQGVPTVSVVVQVADPESALPLHAALPTLRQHLWEQGIALSQFAVFAEDHQREQRDPDGFAPFRRRLPSAAPSRSIQTEEEGVWA